jgi:hypothetical protein
MTRSALASLLALPLLACNPAPVEQEPVVQEPAGQDTAALAAEVELAVAEDLAAVFGSLDGFLADREAGERDEADGPTCSDGAGDCTVCTAVDGGLFGGSFSIESTPLPCGWSTGEGEYSVSWTLNESWIDGQWQATNVWAGDYLLEASGARSATIVTAGPDGSSQRDNQWTLDSLTAVAEGWELSSVAVVLSYEAFLNWDFAVDAVADADGVSGTIDLAVAGLSCVISGDLEAPEVDCELAESR